MRDKLFKTVPSPKYNFGEVVKIKGNEEDAVITDIMWQLWQASAFLFDIHKK